MRYMQVAESIDALIGKPAEIENVIVHDIELIDRETGEVTPATRTVLITPQGKAYGAVSEGVLNSLQMLCNPNLYGSPPWSPPVKLEAVEVKTRSGFKTKRLVPVVK